MNPSIKLLTEQRNDTFTPQGTHGDENLGEVDALLPGATFVEKEGIYVNTEGRPQR